MRNLKVYIGEVYQICKVVSIDAIEKYQAISGDLNPLHYSEDICKNTKFGKIIAPGVLLQSFMVGAIYYTIVLLSPESLPIIKSINTTFLKPGYVGDLVSAVVRIDDVIQERNYLDVTILCEVKGEILCKGNAVLKIIDREKKGE